MTAIPLQHRLVDFDNARTHCPVCGHPWGWHHNVGCEMPLDQEGRIDMLGPKRCGCSQDGKDRWAWLTLTQ